jgi:hypothetical protein
MFVWPRLGAGTFSAASVFAIPSFAVLAKAKPFLSF